jgi:hypothetical protein
LTLTNTASTPVSITGIQFGLADYSQTNNCPSPIPAGASCQITITVTAQEMGDHSTTVSISFDSAEAQVVAIADPTIYFPVFPGGSSIAFGVPTIVGSQSLPEYLQLQSYYSYSGKYVLTVQGPFQLAGSPCATPFSPYTACSVPVVFVPQSLGAAQGSITISFPGLTPTETITLQGTGVASPTPAPYIYSISPGQGWMGEAAFPLTVYGANFTTDSQVMWNGSPRATTFMNNSQLTAQILASDAAVAINAQVTVVNSVGTSAAQVFQVTTSVAPAIQSVSLSDVADSSGNYTLSVTLAGVGNPFGAVISWNYLPLGGVALSDWQVTGEISEPGSGLAEVVVNTDWGSSLPFRFR